MISLIVPVCNEEENIAPLLEEISAVTRTLPLTEVIYVDDGSTDRSAAILEEEKKKYPFLRVIRHSSRAGQSSAFWTGVSSAKNELIVLIDGDGQNNPADIVQLYDIYKRNKDRNPRSMVAGQRIRRQDNLVRRLSSRTANRIRVALLKDGTRDTGCSLKLIRREDYLRLPYFNHMHRYLPALLMRDDVQILHADVSHRPRSRGLSKYGFFNRFWVGITDLAGVCWLMARRRPRNFSYKELP